ncbi:hypothetical protein ES705_46774 [subsurface metagenome]|jgi:hypothetical protein|nr:MAG: hypothetical protein ES695_00970 [Candidatus Atribacteria bacterium 1244-E10-H5-B2]
MQTHGYVIVKNQKILVLVRNKKYSRALKLRYTGADGNFFEDESIFLSEDKKILARLLAGKVIDI